MAWTKTKFEEPDDIRFVKLNKIGDAVEGIFAGTKERKNNFGKSEVQILVKTGENEDKSPILEGLTANQRLLAQIAPVKRGASIRIEYVDDKQNDGVDREGKPLSPTKLYDVMVDDGKPAAAAAPAATNGEQRKAPF